jgi:hypothetical protein
VERKQAGSIRGRGGGLHPESVAGLRIKLLTDKDLAAHGCAVRCRVPIVADSEYPIAGRDSGKINIGRARGCAGLAHDAGTGGIGERLSAGNARRARCKADAVLTLPQPVYLALHISRSQFS